jgi:uncharacterized membrane protein YdbT with pleckstrin-like domain
MKNDIVLHPAKRILVVYALAYLAMLLLIGFAVGFLREKTGLEIPTLWYVWIPLIFLGLGLFCYAFLWRLTSEFRISNECVTGNTGILSRRKIRISLSRIVDYRLMRPLLLRVLGLGSIHIDTAGNDEEIIMIQISNKVASKATKRLDELLRRDQHIPPTKSPSEGT